MKFHAERTEIVELVVDHGIGQAELGNTVFEHTAYFVQRLENFYLEAAACHFAGKRQAGRPRAGNGNLYAVRLGVGSGGGFPEDLSRYRMVVHCGGCTLPPKEMAFRIEQAKSQQVPIVNYGTLIAQLKGVLRRSIKPFPKYRDLL